MEFSPPQRNYYIPRGPRRTHTPTASMRRESPRNDNADAESTVSRRSFLRAGVAALGTTTAGWSFLAGGDGARGRDATATPTARGGRDSWRNMLEDDETSVEAGHRGVGDDSLPIRTETETEPPAEPTATETPAGTETAPDLTRERQPLLEGTIYETPLHVVDAPRDGPTGFVVGGMHGDERAGHRAVRAVTDWRIQRGRLVVLPAANSAALARGTRNGPHGDLNRQFPSTERQGPPTEVARTIWEAVVVADPDWLADLHSSYGIYLSGDGGVGQAIFPSPVAPAKRYAADVVRTVNGRFGISGSLAYDRGGVLDGDRPMLAHRAGELLDLPTFILETTEKLDLGTQVDLHTFSLDRLLRAFGHGPKR